MKNITLSAEEALIEAARERARTEKSTLNEQFRLWLMHYTQQAQSLNDYDSLMSDLRGQFVMGSKLSRDEINAR